MYETFYYLWVKRFFDIRRDMLSFYADFSICPPSCAARPTQGHWAGFGEPRKSSVFLGPQTQLTYFSQISQNPPCMLAVHDVIHIPWSHLLSGIFILTSVNDTSFPRAQQHLRPSLHLTNPCAKRNVLSLTKPKASIYKTKSLGYYITLFLNSLFFHMVQLDTNNLKQIYLINRLISNRYFWLVWTLEWW